MFSRSEKTEGVLGALWTRLGVARLVEGELNMLSGGSSESYREIKSLSQTP